jgi:hypothetical protein
MKKLLYIPIIHNKADLGSLGSQLSLEGEGKYGVSRWQNHLEQVDKSWDEIEVEILKLLKKKSFDRIKIYQDGLPVVGEIGLKIVKDAAEKGSKNFAIIDFNLGFEYRYSKILSGFVNINNLTAGRYQNWYNYPNQRFNLMAGITYAF